MRHFLDFRDLTREDVTTILVKAARVKGLRGEHKHPLKGQSLAMIFEKNSTRTRVSFEVAMNELGGSPLVLQKNDLQLGRGETVADTARVLSRYVHIMMLRAYHHATLVELAQYSTVPVINGLTDLLHPCQVMADLLTIQEKLGSVSGRKIAWVGDGNNMANTYLTAAKLMDFELVLACPDAYHPDAEIFKEAVASGARVRMAESPQDAVTGADVVVTDTWVSMGDDDTLTRKQAFYGYQVNDELMKLAKPQAIFLHCLPAHRGEEVSDAVFDGKQSAVWDEAENRLHTQKAILLWCLEEI